MQTTQKRPRGRPATLPALRYAIDRLEIGADLHAAIEHYRRAHDVSRAEAIRRLLAIASEMADVRRMKEQSIRPHG